MTLSIITVNYNQPRVTLELLRSIDRYLPAIDYEIIVVDNGSAEDVRAYCESEFPKVVYIRSDENLGFAGGNNLGIAKAKGDVLFFVNNDTEFTASLVESLMDTLMADPEIGGVSPKIRYFDRPDLIQFAGFTPMNFFTGRNKCIGLAERDAGQYDDHAQRTGYLHGAAMMVRRQTIEDAGPMPEEYFLYYEEMDWCESFKRNGYELWVQPAAVIYHKESVSTGEHSPLKEYYMVRNRILFIRRNATLFQRMIFIAYFTLIVGPRNIISYISRGRNDLLRAFFWAVGWHLSGRKKPKADL